MPVTARSLMVAPLLLLPLMVLWNVCLFHDARDTGGGGQETVGWADGAFLACLFGTTPTLFVGYAFVLLALWLHRLLIHWGVVVPEGGATADETG